MDNKKKYAISNNSTNNNIDTNKIKSIEGYECIGPCYPANTYYYNPSNLALISNSYPSCPIKEQQIVNPDGSMYKKLSAECDEKDIGKGKLYFDIFDDNIQIATSSSNFLSEIYSLSTITDIVRFLTNDFDNLPIYSQRRLLEAIYSAYYKYIEFPKLLFVKKLLYILKNIYKITNLNEDKIIHKLNNIEPTDTGNLYTYFY